MYQTCIDCGRPFHAESGEKWKKRCLPCWRNWKKRQGEDVDSIGTLRAEMRGMHDECYRLRATITEMEPWARIGRTLAEQWRDVLFLVHPDRHDGHPVAHRLTAWINGEVRR